MAFSKFFSIVATCVVLSSQSLLGQDTLRLMHYNILQYSANQFGGCDLTNNSLDKKDSLFKIIVQHAKPHVVTVNELGNSQALVTRLLEKVFNVNGVNEWKAGQLTSLSGGTLSNMIFYDSRKVRMHSHTAVQNTVRDFNIYRMYFETPELVNGDTIFFVPIVAHLKAGSSETAGRLTMVQALMSRLNNWGVSDNYVLCGDFNVYTSSEPAYQLLLNYSNTAVRFYDPIDTPGDWNNTYNFRHVHTQSTRTSGDCFATGGMDDRFDFIMVSSQILNGFDNVKALPETYKALGQDGNRYNGTIISPTNTAVPQNVASALYNMSDHLPVLMDFLVYYPNAGIKNSTNELKISVLNPFSDEIVFKINHTEGAKLRYSVVNLEGKIVKQGVLEHQDYYQEHRISMNEFQNGLYLLKVFSETGVKNVKILKVK